jgi:hypothetical protein
VLPATFYYPCHLPFQPAGLHLLFESASAVNFDFCVL